MTNEELVALIQNGINVQENMGKLYEQNIRLIYKTMRPYSKDLGTSNPKSKGKSTTVLEQEDVLQECYFILQQAVQKYDTEKGFLFSTHMTLYIKYKSLRFINENKVSKRIPEYELQMIFKYNKFKHEYIKENQEEPSEQEIIDALGITLKKLKQIEKDINQANVQSIEAIIPSSDSLTVAEIIPDDNATASFKEVEGKLYKETLRKDLFDLLDAVFGVDFLYEDCTKEFLLQTIKENRTAKTIILLHYGLFGEPMTFDEIGKVLGVTGSCIQHIEFCGMYKIRNSYAGVVFYENYKEEMIIDQLTEININDYRNPETVAFNHELINSIEKNHQIKFREMIQNRSKFVTADKANSQMASVENILNDYLTFRS